MPGGAAALSAVPTAQRRRLDRPGLILVLGGAVTAALVALSILNAAGPGGFFENLYVITASGAVAIGLAVMSGRAEPAILNYGRLGLAAALTGCGMAVLDVAPWFAGSTSALAANCLFCCGGALAMTVIMPAFYRRLDPQALRMAMLDGGIMLAAGVTLMLSIWKTGDGTDGLGQLAMPVAAAALLATAGVAATAALTYRAVPALSGIWCGIPGVSIVGISWMTWIDAAVRGEPRTSTTTLLYAGGILLLGYAWMTWSDAIGAGKTYEKIAGLLVDWLPIGAILLCVGFAVMPHSRIEGVDAAAVGTAIVVLLSIARQRALIVRERLALFRLQGEERLRAEKDAAEAASQAKSQFLAMMSHEIRTPMNAILGNAALLGDAELGPAERESVLAIETAGQTLLTVINDILDFSKIEANRMELEEIGFAPASIVASVVSLFGVSARDRGLTLVTQVDPSIPVILAGDPHRLHQVLSNLVGNAIKFTRQGSVTIGARVDSRTAEETVLRFDVTDTGIGIDAAGRERLFTPFVQVDSSATRRFDGTGLGLAICRRLVGLMGGEIDVSSTPGVGSTFWFTVRLATPTDNEAGDVLLANENVVRTAGLAGARVLVAEDNLANQRLIERILTRLGIVPTMVGNGRAAIESVRSGSFNLVLMDCHMPTMDGFEATRAIRAEGFQIPVVALTADAMSGDRDTCLASGMSDYLSKPIVTSQLYATLLRWIPEGREIGPLAISAMAAAEGAGGGLIDQRQIMELFALDPDGSAGFLPAMVQSYELTLAETLPGMRAALAAQDPSALEDSAHKLKGVAANLGVRRVIDCTTRLVVLARAETTVGGEPILAELEAAIGPAADALAALLTGAGSLPVTETRAA
ncbi:MAG TPA: ATP-binding protein [Candidatus Limnocylindrales bacterium]